MKELIFRVAILLLFSILRTVSINACSCATVSVQKSIKYSSAIFGGVVISHEVIKAIYPVLDRKEETTIVRYRIEVKEVYKGFARKDTVTVLSGYGGGDCGIDLFEGKEYIIYGSKQQPGKLTPVQKQKGRVYLTHICTRTQLANDEELEELRRYKK